MKKLFFVLFGIFLTFNVFAFDFDGRWIANFEMVDKDGKSDRGKVEVDFSGNKCTFYQKNTQNVYTYKRDENFFFLARLGYEIKIKNDDKFILFPRFGSDIKYIVFVRKENEWERES